MSNRTPLSNITNTSNKCQARLNFNNCKSPNVDSCKKTPSKENSRDGTSNCYEVIFPPGPMGLELEPVIISSERQLGCRVKDFYFGIDHIGISQEYIQRVVHLGDLITHVEEKSVLSMAFTEILDTLRTLKSQSRTVRFKTLNNSSKFIIYISNCVLD